MAPRARQAKSKARIKAYEQMAAEGFEERPDELEIQIPPGKHLGDLVIETRDLSKRLRRPVLIEDLNFRLPPGGIVGIIGPNGAGKTTLFRMMIGRGTARRPASCASAPTVELGYVDQNRDALDAEQDGVRGDLRRPRHARDGRHARSTRGPTCRASTSAARTRRRRSATSRAANATASTWPSCSGAAPTCCCWTNRRTIWTSTRCAPWKKRFSNFAGCVVVISHDRWFLDRIATHILAFEGDGYVHWCEGNFQTYEQQRRSRLGLAGDQPQRFRYKRLKR